MTAIRSSSNVVHARNDITAIRGMRQAIAKFTHFLTTTTLKKPSPANALWWRLYEFERPVKKRTRLFRLISACRRILLCEKPTALGRSRQQKRKFVYEQSVALNLGNAPPTPESRKVFPVHSVTPSDIVTRHESAEVHSVAVTSSAVNLNNSNNSYAGELTEISIAADADVTRSMEDVLIRVEAHCTAE